MNKHIELVEKWLADPLLVSRLELEASAGAANAAATAANNALHAACDTNASNARYAAYAASEWVAKYRELIKEQE